MKMLEDSLEVKFSKQTSHESPSNQQNNSPEAVNSDPVSVSSNNSRKVTHRDIEIVQNLIERCLQLYMNRSEVVNTLLHQARIEPGFTTLVWQKLEEENPDFFKAYYMRLVLKKQIMVFNQLLEYQYYQMKSPAHSKVPLENGIHHFLVNNLPMGYTTAQQPPIPSTDHRQIGPMGVPGSHVVNEMPASGDFHSAQLNSGKEMVMNGRSADLLPGVPGVKLEMALSPTSVASVPFTPTEISDLSLDTSLDSAYASHMTSQEGLLPGPDCGTDNSKESLQPFCQIPWNLSFSDLAADLTNVEDHGQLGNYSGSDILLDSPEQNDIGFDRMSFFFQSRIFFLIMLQARPLKQKNNR
ncbi:uncharacterized protein LOC105648352 isoform X2 [Jatropha curcas]|uniref:uncharacterized protein LOC105648352 isoform X2 n=1 Tax=Jatropha curcas TaxID=180498 RepID=UPI0009D69C5C|nr:uncharacterized protein LOC105648352 isoform X2 [Jatropha curcas]